MQNKITSGEQLSRDYEIVEKAIAFIEAHHEAQPSLAAIASAVNLSEFHFQKIFSRWVGISPKRFLQFLTKEHAKKLLKQSRNLLDVTYDSGLSSPGRLHDLFIHCEAVTPGEYKVMGQGLSIRFGFSYSPFGKCLTASTSRGLCALKFVRDLSDAETIQWLRGQWPCADLVPDDLLTDTLVQKIFAFGSLPESAPLHLFIKGTNFQIKVWEALMAIPFGTAVTYEDIANHIGLPGATRAVGTAVGKNPIPFLIPCHRVIRKMGAFGQYGGGRERKMAMIGWESARLSHAGKAN
jgi:AraC family transcriptional regulator, regulatory protein of adaptative response / methylated-DNA-[protein]-cysteine methyltransferase